MWRLLRLQLSIARSIYIVDMSLHSLRLYSRLIRVETVYVVVVERRSVDCVHVREDGRQFGSREACVEWLGFVLVVGLVRELRLRLVLQHLGCSSERNLCLGT